MKKSIILSFVIVVMLALAACGGNQAPASPPAAAAPPAAATAAEPAAAATETAAEPAGDQVFRIGVSLPPILNDFHAGMRRSIEDTIANAPANFEFTVVSALDEGDQFNVLEVFYNENFDGVIISPLNGTLIAPIAEQIYFSGTPTVIINRAIDSEHYTTFVACDNEGGSRTAAHHIAEVLGGEGTVFIARMSAGTPIDSERTYPFLEAIAEHPGITVLGDAEAGNTREGGFNMMQNAMAAHPVINAVFAGSEVAGLGVAHAAELAGRDELKIVIGFGASQALVDELDGDPNFIAQAMCYVAGMGGNAVEAMMAIMRGEDVGKRHLRESIVLNRDNLHIWREWAH